MFGGRVRALARRLPRALTIIPWKGHIMKNLSGQTVWEAVLFSAFADGFGPLERESRGHWDQRIQTDIFAGSDGLVRETDLMSLRAPKLPRGSCCGWWVRGVCVYAATLVLFRSRRSRMLYLVKARIIPIPDDRG